MIFKIFPNKTDFYKKLETIELIHIPVIVMNRHPSLFVFIISAVLTIRRLEKNVFYMFFPLQSAVLSLKIIVFGICKWEFVRYLTPANNKERYSIRTFYVHLKKKLFSVSFSLKWSFSTSYIRQMICG